MQLIAIGELRRAIGLGRLGRKDGDLGAPPPAVAPHVRAGPDDQPVQLGIEPLDVAQRGQIAPNPHQRLLGGILREFGVAQDEAGDRVQPIDGATGQDTEGVAVPASRPVDEHRLHASLPSRGDRSGRLHPTAGRKARWFNLRPRRARVSERLEEEIEDQSAKSSDEEREDNADDEPRDPPSRAPTQAGKPDVLV